MMAASAAFIVVIGLSALWHRAIMPGFYEKHYEAAALHGNRLCILIGFFVIGVLLSLIYTIGCKCGAPLKEGPRCAVIMGLVGLLL